MAFVATLEQKAIIEAALVEQRIVACAGSGKTATAVRRLLEIRRRLGPARGYVALLSYSNVAVDTFRDEYRALASESPGLSDRVLIATVDSFITSQILLPHASRTMQCDRQPFLVQGHEPFLNAFPVFNGDRNVGIEHLHVSLDETSNPVYTESSFKGARKPVSEDEALKGIFRLAKTGAYTYELGRFWALVSLLEQSRLSDIMARRYPYVLVDEAQDVGVIHGALLSTLKTAGCKVSLIGDPNQSIYEFADADGSFLRNFIPAPGGLDQPLTENRRSVQAVVALANQLSNTDSKAIREAPARKHGAYFMRYKPDELDQLLAAFAAILKANGFGKSEAVVLCRGTPLVERLTGGADEMGQGATEKFACAAVCRDRLGDISVAFEFALDGVLKVLDKPPAVLRRDVLSGANAAGPRAMRRLVWQFLKNIDLGLPSSSLGAKAGWLPLLKKRLPVLLASIEGECGLARLDSWTYNVTVAKVGEGPLWQQDLIEEDIAGIPVRTVHRVKGESIGAVLYVAKPRDIHSLLEGPASEEGRIGYVAVTRAKDLLILAVPEKTPSPIVEALKAKGFVAWE